MQGYIHLYTGNGKGKTTAALGLALRAAGAGKKVFFAQFVKGKLYSEIDAINRFIPSIKVEQYGRGCFITEAPTQEDINAAKRGLAAVEKIIIDGDYDLVVLDEACIAIYFKLFTSAELINVVQKRPQSMEIVITGRYATDELIELADLVTEMKEIKHYYSTGVEARKGIEF